MRKSDQLFLISQSARWQCAVNAASRRSRPLAHALPIGSLVRSDTAPMRVGRSTCELSLQAVEIRGRYAVFQFACNLGLLCLSRPRPMADPLALSRGGLGNLAAPFECVSFLTHTLAWKSRFRFHEGLTAVSDCSHYAASCQDAERTRQNFVRTAQKFPGIARIVPTRASPPKTGADARAANSSVHSVFIRLSRAAAKAGAPARDRRRS